MLINPLVIDISHWQSFSDWKHYADTGLVGVINKATEGPGLVDSSFTRRAGDIHKAGLLLGAYHFARPGDPKQQAQALVNVVAPFASLNVQLFLDHEDRRVPLSWAVSFIKELQLKTGKWAGLYSGFLIKEQIGQASVEEIAVLKRCKLWLAQYSHSPSWPPIWSKPWLWQYTSNGHGIDGDEPVEDINSYDGTAEQLRSEWGN